MSGADGIAAVQPTGDRVASAYHYSNVVNNSMRGGVPVDGYNVDPSDFAGFVQAEMSTSTTLIPCSFWVCRR